MNDIASSLEQEFADVSHAERAVNIAELRQIEAAGRGTVNIAPHAIILPLLLCGLGVLLLYGATTGSARSWSIPAGLALLLPSLWVMFGPRKPRFTLTEQGVQVKGVLLPWGEIDDFSVTERCYNGLTMNTSVLLHYQEGYTPPKLGLSLLFGGNTFIRKTRQHQTRLTLHVGARGMDSDELAQRIGQFLASWHARAELARLRAD